MSDYKSDLSNSSVDFQRVVWPAISPWFGGGEIIHIETMQDTDLARKLDICSGIDAWHVAKNQQIRGIASRIQWEQRGWDTFTVRYSRNSGAKTEYEKRSEAINSKHGWLYPAITVHAYVSKPAGAGDLLSVAAVKTSDLISCCEWIVNETKDKKKKDDRREYGIRATSNAYFIYSSWEWMKSRGTAVCTHRKKMIF